MSFYGGNVIANVTQVSYKNVHSTMQKLATYDKKNSSYNLDSNTQIGLVY